MTSLNILWFIILMFIISMYAILDGFDLGIGFWFSVTTRSKLKLDRSILIRLISPFWDGNEVWLLAIGGILFAAFPDAYATVFSTFYIPIMLLVACLMLRAVAIEFRNDLPTYRGQNLSDIGFQVGSMIPAILFGVVMGNLLSGIPLDSTKNFTGNLFTLITPYTLLAGCLGASVFTIHGAFYMIWRTQGEFTKTAKKWMNTAVYAYLVLIILTFLATGIFYSQRFDNYMHSPILIIIPIASIGAVVLAKYLCNNNEEFKAFIFSAFSIALLVFSAGIALYPDLIPAVDPLNSITIINAAASDRGLRLQLIITIIGLTMILAYTIWIHSILSDKVQIE